MFTYVSISVVALALAAVFNAIMDTLAHHYSASIFANRKELFWNPAKSWRNKYKDGDPDKGERFFGSSRWFVFLTDGWHLAKFGMLSFLPVPAAVALLWINQTEYRFYLAIGAYIVIRAAFASLFHIFYHKVLYDEDRRNI